MTISKKVFGEIKRQNPEITDICGTNGNYQVVFHNRKMYTYRVKSLSELCGRLGIKAIRQHEIDNLKNVLNLAIKAHGKRSIFGDKVIDNSEAIARYRKLLEKYKGYIIFD